MIDLSTEHLLTLPEAARLLPGRPSTCTLWRWRSRGVYGVRLDSCLIGGRRYTSREAIERFVAGCSAAGDGQAAPLRTPAARERAIARAERELADAGI